MLVKEKFMKNSNDNFNVLRNIVKVNENIFVCYSVLCAMHDSFSFDDDVELELDKFISFLDKKIFGNDLQEFNYLDLGNRFLLLVSEVYSSSHREK